MNNLFSNVFFKRYTRDSETGRRYEVKPMNNLFLKDIFEKLTLYLR